MNEAGSEQACTQKSWPASDLKCAIALAAHTDSSDCDWVANTPGAEFAKLRPPHAFLAIGANSKRVKGSRIGPFPRFCEAKKDISPPEVTLIIAQEAVQ